MDKKKSRKSGRLFVKRGKPLYKYKDSSPYWDGLENNKAEKEFMETRRANPEHDVENSLHQLYKDQHKISIRKTVLKELLRVAIKRTKLTDKQYTYITKFFYEGESLMKIADDGGVSFQSVQQAIQRGVKKIKKVADKMVEIS